MTSSTPSEVIPEFTADVGIKKGERINDPLRIEHASQLFRYFAVTNARIAILTNGEVYQFYTDLDAPNHMDAKPLLVLDFSDLDETLLSELAKLACTKDLSHSGYVSSSSPYVNVSKNPTETEPVPEEEPMPADLGGEIATTEEEIEGYRIVRAIVCSEVPVARVVARDTKTYCGVLLDDNKVETRIPIDDVQDIYQHADHLRETVARYLAKGPQVEETALPMGPVLAG